MILGSINHSKHVLFGLKIHVFGASSTFLSLFKLCLDWTTLRWFAFYRESIYWARYKVAYIDKPAIYIFCTWQHLFRKHTHITYSVSVLIIIVLSATCENTWYVEGLKSGEKWNIGRKNKSGWMVVNSAVKKNLASFGERKKVYVRKKPSMH